MSKVNKTQTSEAKVAANRKNGQLGGRPRKTGINAKDLFLQGKIGCTETEAAALFGVSLETLRRRMEEDPSLRQAWIEGHEDGKASLRRKQMQMALEEGNPAILIWLGKNRLGQKDASRMEHTGANGGPIKTLELSAYSADGLEALEKLLASGVEAQGESSDS